MIYPNTDNFHTKNRHFIFILYFFLIPLQKRNIGNSLRYCNKSDSMSRFISVCCALQVSDVI